MKKYIHILLFGILFLELAACERVLTLEENGKEKQAIVLSAIVNPDTVFTATVGKTFDFSELPALVGEYRDYYLYSNLDDSYKSILTDAQVELQVNDTDYFLMNYDSVTHVYISSYKPLPSDRITVSIKEAQSKSATATTLIPRQPEIEIVSAEKIYHHPTFVPDGEVDRTGTDTLIILSLRITDPVEEKNYYRLKLRSCGIVQGDFTEGVYSDIYSSTDQLFYNPNLKKDWGGWPAYFSNIFSDEQMNGKEYTFTVESRMRGASDPHWELELQALSENLYNYLEAVMRYRITDFDDYTESIYLPTNVDNGFGILGAVHSDRKILRWLGDDLVVSVK